MVNTVSHLGVGLLIALALGFKGNKRWTIAFLSILPDLDFIPHMVFFFISDSLSHAARNQLFYILGHREFMHSLLFISLVTLLLWFRTKDRLLTAGGFAALISHFYMDYATSWKMRPLYPFSTDSSILGAIYFFDPLLNLLPLLPLFIVLVDEMKNRGRWEGKFKGFCTYVRRNDNKLYAALIFVLMLWFAVAPIAKVLVVHHISEAEGAEISYQNTYPASAGRFLSAYSYNDTHYRILETTYWGGIERSGFVEKMSVSGDVPEASEYAAKTEKLYLSGVPLEIDYPVYNVSGENGSVTVVLSDARNPYIRYWAYFETVYRFVFYEDSEEYEVYASVHGEEEERLADNWFERELVKLFA
ncbi:metal-dependent hydrolase [Methanosarcina sp. KYL-1]|uniref:metal-dependent hydrolase n=1 Tax=Methanosarcina sp. KYL-1 TaxID=2602068 RepID=UPI002100B034|nr:metal-dependent hydrolase [Methanosarcina sp. KYL-1]MCQ1537229.1 metal-dependent hydrolase [Methanosarcina sp. KYL-1]